MSDPYDAVALTQKLVSFDTVNPPGNEEACTAYLGMVLEEAGFAIDYYEMAPGRTSLVARCGARNALRTLCFIGHTDTVPLGKAPWSHSPFGGEIHNGRLYGRGASDMKSGIAAFVVAAIHRKAELPKDTGLIIIVVAGEETGCEGSTHLASMGLHLGELCGVIVGEPTDNMPFVGHKGALWLQATFKGVSAHGSMPSAGVNAIRKGAEVVRRLDGFYDHCKPHAVLGQPTINIGAFRGGENVNSVPDWAAIDIDIRTIPGMESDQTRQEMVDLMLPHLDQLNVQADMLHVWTPPENDWVQRVFSIVAEATGEQPCVRAAPYFTDASALQPIIKGAPTLILGPGSQAMMHQTDEYCEVSKVEEAVTIYKALIDATLGTEVAIDSVGASV